MATTKIKNLIFDLGGVIINLDLEKTYQQLSKLSGKSAEEIKKIREGQFFIDYEEGLISDAAFRDQIRDSLEIDISDTALDEAWNAMLLDIPSKRLELLDKLKFDYSVFLLSNTNNIHLQRFTEIALNTSGRELNSYFNKAYYSHIMQMKKPDAQIYSQVLKENNLIAAETIFFDDNLSNLKGAEAVGINTFHVHHPDLILSYFNEPKA